MEKQLNVTDVIDQLSSEGLVAEKQKEEILALSQSKDTSSPWYIYGLIGFTAWFASIFFLIFLFGMIKPRKEGIIVIGAILCGLAIGFTWIFKKSQSIFWAQVFLVLSFAGQIFVIIGIGDTMGARSPVLPWIIIGLQVAMSFVYRHPVQMFIAPIVISGCLLVYIVNQEAFQMVHFLVAGLAVLAGFLWTKESYLSKKEYFKNITYGVSLAFLGVVCISLVPDKELPHNMKIFWEISTYLLLACLLFLEHLILQENNSSKTIKISVFAITIVFAIICRSSPGLLAALFMAILSFFRGNKLMLSLSFIFLAVFLTFFYHSLRMDLLDKSLVLMASGALLLGARMLFNHLFTTKLQEA